MTPVIKHADPLHWCEAWGEPYCERQWCPVREKVLAS